MLTFVFDRIPNEIMKVKEFPSSIYHTLKLRYARPSSLVLESRQRVPVVVSMTSIPSRLNKLDVVVRSIFNQTVLPNKLLLWLEEGLEDQVPERLSKLQGDIFEIRYCAGTYPHRKLIHTIAGYPDTTIVTCDDDFIYAPNWLENLYKQHLKYPNLIVANHIRKIRYTKDETLMPYKQWIYNAIQDKDSKLLLCIGGKGVLYPPKALSDEVFDEDLFLKLTPRADDLWFKAMALRKGTHNMLSELPVREPIPIMGTQAISLKKENVDKDRNLTQWKQLQEHFNFPKA